MDFNIDLANEALDDAARTPEYWDNGSGYWAFRRFRGGVVTGLAGHVASISGVHFAFLNETDFTTNYVRTDDMTPPHALAARDYAERKNLGWPDGLCSISLAAILMLGLEALPDLQATRLVGTSGSIEYVRGVLQGFYLR